jgi:hypothetical protein
MRKDPCINTGRGREEEARKSWLLDKTVLTYAGMHGAELVSLSLSLSLTHKSTPLAF